MNHHRPMVYVGGGGRNDGQRPRLEDLGWGYLFSRAKDGPWQHESLRFVFDNGAFAAWRHGHPFPESEFMRRVDRCYRWRLIPDFVVLPDVVADAPATLESSERWAPRLPETWPKYFALQDGAVPWRVAAFCRRVRVAGLFLGGTDWFKDAHAARWREFAHDHGLKFHYGRAGTPRKFAHAMEIGADSLDSTRLSRSLRDFWACRNLWLWGGDPRLFTESHSPAPSAARAAGEVPR